MPTEGFDPRALLRGLDIAEVEERHKRDSKILVSAFLEILDSLEALHVHVETGGHGAPDPALARTIGIIVRRARRTLGDAGVSPMDAAGTPLNLASHDVVAIEPRTDVPPDTVIEERVRGYVWKGVPLRRAQVVIASAKDASEGE